MLGTPKKKLTQNKTLQSSAEEASAVRLLGPPFVIIAQFFFPSFHTSLQRMADGAPFHDRINKYSKKKEKRETFKEIKKDTKTN